jgi:hypothetical protein
MTTSSNHCLRSLLPNSQKYLRGGRNALTAAVVATPLCISLAAAAGTCGNGPDAAPDNLRFVQYFLSRPQDMPACAMQVVNGRIVVPPPTTNAALACPDMFAWKLFAEAVTAEFWKNWATDQEVWPGNGYPDGPGLPLALCAKGKNGPGCCAPDSMSNPGYDDSSYKAKSCPYFPGDHLAKMAAGMPERVGVVPSKAHMLSFANNPRFRENLVRDAELLRQMSEKPGETEGRKIRQAMAELVFRNKSSFDYIFQNNLYNQEGILTVVQKNDDNIRNGAPYRISNDAGTFSEIVFPTDAVMIKSNWLSRERAEEMGVRDDPAHPYIKMNITSPVTDRRALARGVSPVLEGHAELGLGNVRTRQQPRPVRLYRLQRFIRLQFGRRGFAGTGAQLHPSASGLRPPAAPVLGAQSGEVV